jgi:hypothetical protein
MVLHSSLSSSHANHHVKGMSTVAPMDLTVHANAYRMRLPTSLRDFWNVDTTTSGVSEGRVTWYNSTDDIDTTVNGGSSATWTFNVPTIQNTRYEMAIASDPTLAAGRGAIYVKSVSFVEELFYNSDGGVVQITSGGTVAGGASASGTTALTFTINSDASASVDEDPALILLGGDGIAAPNNDIVRSRFIQDSSAEVTYFRQERNRNGAGFSTINTVLGIGDSSGTSTSNVGILRLYSGDGTTARSIDLKYTRFNGVDHLDMTSTPISWGAGEIKLGREASATTTGAIAIGGNSSSTDADSIIIGYFAAQTGSSTRCVAIGGRVSGTGVNIGHNECVLIGAGLATTATNQILLGSANATAAYDFYVGPVTRSTPRAATIQPGGASGSNIAGVSMTIAGGKSTGTGVGGDVVISACPAGTSSGTTLNSLIEAMRMTSIRTNTLSGGASATVLWSMVVAEGQTVTVDALVQARTGTEAAGWRLIGTVRRNSGGNVTIVDAVDRPHEAKDDAGWDASIAVDTASQTVRITGTPDAADNTTFGGGIIYRVQT